MKLPAAATVIAARILARAMLLAPIACVAAGDADPLGSARWEDMRRNFFADHKVVFDNRIQVTAPATAEDPMNVPIRINASEVPDVRRVVIIADFNPILEVLRYYPDGALANLGFRVKLQQSTPVRAAAMTGDGVWHLGGTWVNTAGGGCTAPSAGSASPEWQKRLGEVSGRIFLPARSKEEADVGEAAPGAVRLRLRIIHPMDTGLAPGIPAFFLQELKVADKRGRELMRIEAFEPVSENPVFTVDLPGEFAEGYLRVSGSDNNGNRIDGRIAP